MKREKLVLKVRRAIENNAMLKAGEVIVCAVSGGIDSVVMLYVLASLKDEYSLKLVVAHLNHNLRGAESQREMAFTKALAKRFGARFHAKTLKEGALGSASVQEAARLERRRFLEQTAMKFKAAGVATGHNLDDQAETMLMRLIKGASLSGLAGIRLKRGMFIRPLLDVSRAEIESYAKANGIEYVVDSSNMTDKYLRNDVRHHLMCYIRRRYNPNIAETIARTASLLRADEEYIGREAQKAFQDALITTDSKTITLDVDKLVGLHSAIVSRVYLSAVHFLIGDSKSYSHYVKQFIDLIKSSGPNAVLRQPGVWSERNYTRVTITSKAPLRSEFRRIELAVPGLTVFKGAGIGIKAEIVAVGRVPERFLPDEATAYFDYDMMPRCNLVARPMLAGDRIVPFGLAGTKKVKDLYIDKKVPAFQRRVIPLILSGEDILWIPGVKRSDLYRLSGTTKRVLKLVKTVNRDR
ncbi:MAG: tRNA lysidine(34) synthetase TilS [Deltaproteobacteria bacterium]|nr:tRNA lysidine(34) synthetase TilS [Deltaproteobacteria bacterium]